MKAMILAAGVGSRLDPLTRNVPKPMVPIVNRPVIEHLIEKLKKSGFDEIVINVHYLGGVIRDYVGDGSKFGVKIHVEQEDQLWGDAGSLKRVEAHFQNETFLVIGGDDISNIDISGLVAFHKDKKATSTIATTLVDDPSQFGIVLTDEDGRINRFLEKPKTGGAFSNTANTGVYVFEPEVFALIPSGVAFGFGNNVFPALLEAGKPLYAFHTQSYWQDVGNLQVYRQTNFDAINGKVQLGMPFTEQSPGVWVGEGAQIDPSATLEAPIVIGNNATVEAGASLLANTILGDNTRIESGATLKSTILWDGASVGANTYVERCVIGVGATVSSNVGVFDANIVDTRKAHV
jgi:NDP-sugar pyrophosphorylase family protein